MKETKPILEKPSVLFTTGVNLFYWAVEISLKGLAMLFFWNNGIVLLSHSIPKLTFIICVSILFMISMVTRLIGNSLADTLLIRGFVFYQQVQLTKELIDNAKRTVEEDDR